MDVIFDVDGTIADCSHRRPLVERPKLQPDQPVADHMDQAVKWKPDWPRFHDLAHLDTPIRPVIELAQALWWHGHRIVITTGRPATHWAILEQWLSDHAVPRDDVYMRPAGDTRPDEVIKAELLERIRNDGYNPVLAIEDRSKVVAFWRSQGIICLQAAPGDF